LLVTKPLGLQAEEHQHCQERLHTLVAKTQGGSALAVEHDRLLQGLKPIGSKVAVMTEFLHLQHPPVGSEADLAQAGQVVQPPTHANIVGLLMVVSVRSARPSL
jgi:hypothetical protein